MCTRVVQTNIGRDEAGEQVGPYQYDSFDAFLCDVRLVFTNAITYNAKHKGGVYDAASALLKSFEGEVKVAKKRLSKPSKSIKTLCTEMMNRLCSEVVDGQKAAASFMDPVDQKVFQTYRSFVTKPMDLRTIRVRATACTTVHVFACVCVSLCGCFCLSLSVAVYRMFVDEACHDMIWVSRLVKAVHLLAPSGRGGSGSGQGNGICVC